MESQFFSFDFDSGFKRQTHSHAALNKGEILIRVTCCTICGSDLHTFTGRRSAPVGCVLGHEIIGEIVQLSQSDSNQDYQHADFYGQPLSIGQRVTWSMAVGCGSCFYCDHDLPQKCESLFKYGHAPGANGPTGGLSEFCVLVPGTQVFVLPDSISDEVACPANCATATVFAALRMVRETHLISGSTILITGAGMLGLTAAAMCADAGAKRILLVDPNEKRTQLARQFGATQVVRSTNELRLNRGADIALDFAGVPSAVESCIDAVRIGGCVMLVGSAFPSRDISIAPEQILRRMLTIRGLHNYRPSDLGDALQFLERTSQRFAFQRLVSKTFSLEETASAFEFAIRESPVRVAVRAR